MRAANNHAEIISARSFRLALDFICFFFVLFAFPQPMNGFRVQGVATLSVYQKKLSKEVQVFQINLKLLTNDVQMLFNETNN